MPIRITRLEGIIFGAVVLTLVLGSALLPTRAQPAGPDEVAKAAEPEPEAIKPRSDLAHERIQVARKALEVLEDQQRNGIIPPSDPRIDLWRRRLVETLREPGGDRAELIAALQDYRNQLKSEEAFMQEQVDRGQKTIADQLEARYRVLEAETWLVEAKAR